MNIDHLLKFTVLLDQFRQVRRAILVNGENRQENDAEHSFALAMFAWYVAEKDKLPLDTNKVLKYALAHDIVEVYAGDTYFYSKDEAHVKSKIEREKNAAERLLQEFPEFRELHQMIEQYGMKKDMESKFVYALDKIQPLLHIYLDDGRTWKTDGVTLGMLVEAKEDKIKVSPEVEKYWNEIKDLLKREEKKLFPSLE